MELVEKIIHMNRQKGKALSQITLDDDCNVPEDLPDVENLIQEKGKVVNTEIYAEDGKIYVKGTLEFEILYIDNREEKGLHNIGGSIIFSEILNVEGAKKGDTLRLSCKIEDLIASIINSRKLSLKSLLTFMVVVEELVEEEVTIDCEDTEVEKQYRDLSLATLAIGKRDTCRIKDEIILPVNKPNIERAIWEDIGIRGVETRIGDGELQIKGEVVVFLLYESEDESQRNAWIEQVIPFHSTISCQGCLEEMLGNPEITLAHSDMEIKPDYDGELRVLNIDVVLDCDIRLYREEKISLLSDLYEPKKILDLETVDATCENLLLANASRCKVQERIKIEETAGSILQICHSFGEVKIDEVQRIEEGLWVEGVVETNILYVTVDDQRPFAKLKGVLPFEYKIEVPGMKRECNYTLQTALEQFGISMVSSEELEVKVGILLNVMVLEPVNLTQITKVEEEILPADILKNLPSMTIYTVQPKDTLWQIAKEYHTTTDRICNLNQLAGREVRANQKLFILKEV